MPLYDFRCEACANRFEARTSTDAPPATCPACGSAETTRLLSPFASGYLGRPRGAAAQRSDDTRRVREEQRSERKAARAEQRRADGRA